MERQLVVWCPGLLEQHENGREARATSRVLEAVGKFSPEVTELRPGTCAVATRGPSRYFGGDENLARLVDRALGEVHDVEDDVGHTRVGVVAGIGVADGLFAACLAARSSLRDPVRAPVIVPPGLTPEFLSPWPVDSLERPELADLLRRLGVRTLGAFADLPADHVLARFGLDGSICREVAAGVEGELPGLRLPVHLPARRSTRTGAASAAGPSIRQPGFFGGTAEADARASRAVAAVQGILHAEAVVRARLQGGRGPAERARLVPWGEHVAGSSDGALHPQTFPRKRSDTKGAGEGADSPWPGQVPAPSPAVVLGKALPAELVDSSGRQVEVTGGGIATAAPARLSITGGPWSEVAGWAGPWPSDERWWSKRGRTRQARMQVVTSAGTAYLLTRRRGWWVEGIYD